MYPDRKLRDISVAFCFICILHLANEKDLRIVDEGGLSDLRIYNV
jgi:condensin complex subunit 2